MIIYPQTAGAPVLALDSKGFKGCVDDPHI